MSKLRSESYFFTKYEKAEDLPEGHVSLHTINLILSEVDQVLSTANELQALVCQKYFVLHS